LDNFVKENSTKSNPNISWKFGQALDSIEKLLMGEIS
jgi:hypothetical protein